jgi:hypothetical protein
MLARLGTPYRLEGKTDFPVDHRLTPFTLREAMRDDYQAGPGRFVGPFVKVRGNPGHAASPRKPPSIYENRQESRSS